MSRSPRAWFRLASLGCLLASLGAGDDKPTRAEVVKRGKAATAFVEVPAGRSSGTAFCVYPSGLFVTNEHVVRAAGAGAGPPTPGSPPQTQRGLQAPVDPAPPAVPP